MRTLLTSKPVTRVGEAVVCTQSLIVIGVFYYIPALLAYAATCVRSKKKRIAILLSTLATILITKHGKWSQWNAFKFHEFWQHLFSYFNVTVVGHPPPPGQCIYGISPHGIVPYSLGLAAYGPLAKLLSAPRIVTASILDYVPLFSQILKWGGSIEATNEAISEAIAQGSGIAFSPGGIAEMFCHPHSVVLRSRKGFIRLALLYGLPIVPVYVFGATSIFNRVPLPQALETVSRYWQASVMLFYGVGGLPIPHQTALLYAMGKSIILRRGGYSSLGCVPAEEVDFVLNTYIRSLEEVFQEYRRGYGWVGVDLRVE